MANAPHEPVATERHLDLPYGSDPRQRLDLYRPAGGGAHAVVVFWYGGSWSAGSKHDYRFVGETLAAQGFIAVLPDYRLYPQVTFPAFDEDGARAVAWVERHAAEYGGDARRIVLMGHSAGAHTAAMLAYDHQLLRASGGDPGCIAGLVGLSGPYELMLDSPGIQAAFPAPSTPRDWQPIWYVDSAAPPTLLLHGAHDRDVRAAEAVDLQRMLEARGIPVELHLYAHRGHGATIASFAWIMRWRTPAVRDTVQFVRRVTADPQAVRCLSDDESGR